MQAGYQKYRRTAATLCLTLVAICPRWHEAAGHSLIVDEPGPPELLRVGQTLPDTLPPARRSRTVSLTPRIAAPGGLAADDSLRLDLFDDARYSARVDRVSVNVNGTVSVRARIDGHPLGYLLISTTDGRSLGSVHVPEHGRHFIIQSEHLTGQHYLIEVDGAQLGDLPCGGSSVPPPPTREQAIEMQRLEEITAQNSPLDLATITVMIVYTPAALNWANTSGGGIANIVAQSMERAQLLHDNSNTVLTLNLVHSAEVDYVEVADDGTTDLFRLTDPADGYMDEVHGWRDQYAADLVALFTQSSYGGRAWELHTISGYPDLGFTITRIQQAATTDTHGHELGHNMGCGHHKEQSVYPGPGVLIYSAGWRWTGSNGVRYNSVMAYGSGAYYEDGLNHIQVPHFSSPDVLYWDVPTGHATHGDNAHTIRLTKHAIAGYRNFLPHTPSLISPLDAAANVILTPTLQASAFSDPDGDAHANSHWQVARDAGFTDLAWDSGESYPAGTQVTLATNTLRGSRTYHWRVRYKDNLRDWSNWSPAGSFNTRLAGDFDGDNDVDQEDFARFQRCLSGPGVPQTDPACAPALLDADDDVDQNDFAIFYGCMSGPGIPANPACAD